MPLEVDQDIVDELTSEYGKASSILPFTTLELKGVFSEQEMARLGTLLNEMRKATNDNERRALFVRGVTQYADVVFKLLKMAKVVV